MAHPPRPIVLDFAPPAAARPEWAALPEPDAPEETVVRQVLQRMARDVGGLRTELMIKLEPPVLGRVSLTLSQQADRLTAEFVATQAAAREALERGLPELREALSRQGLHVEALVVRLEPETAQAAARAGIAERAESPPRPQSSPSSQQDQRHGQGHGRDYDDEPRQRQRERQSAGRHTWWA